MAFLTDTACPFSKSDMTPCVLKDGNTCFAMDGADNPVCVGCGKSPRALGVPAPADWHITVARYYAEHPHAAHPKR